MPGGRPARCRVDAQRGAGRTRVWLPVRGTARPGPPPKRHRGKRPWEARRGRRHVPGETLGTPPAEAPQRPARHRRNTGASLVEGTAGPKARPRRDAGQAADAETASAAARTCRRTPPMRTCRPQKPPARPSRGEPRHVAARLPTLGLPAPEAKPRALPALGQPALGQPARALPALAQPYPTRLFGGSGKKPLVRRTYSAYPGRRDTMSFSSNGLPVPFRSSHVMITGPMIVSAASHECNANR
ncbi:hypothetical protein SAMN04488074_120109 [Lentzea albidocapillata subsp. violacea]|uniref:Uncharacterized protein n=1 Tax=Lentzea albidocapillata subsp. violacea TaxID=128104 RepID=A0A1G9SMG0_9PSEU|nr:hypothetical protein SAMN04488074_120109 [Lentzea albidocapillata subsp. violacea]